MCHILLLEVYSKEKLGNIDQKYIYKEVDHEITYYRDILMGKSNVQEIK